MDTADVTQPASGPMGYAPGRQGWIATAVALTVVAVLSLVTLATAPPPQVAELPDRETAGQAPMAIERTPGALSVTRP